MIATRTPKLKVLRSIISRCSVQTSKIVYFAVAIAGVAAATVAYLRLEARVEAAESAAAAATASVHVLSARPARVLRSHTTRSVVVESPPDSPAERRLDGAAGPPPSKPDKPMSRQERLERLADDFAAEPYDEPSSAKTEARLWEAVAEASNTAKPGQLAITCRRVHCRLDATFASEDEYNAFVEAMFIGPQSLYLDHGGVELGISDRTPNELSVRAFVKRAPAESPPPR